MKLKAKLTIIILISLGIFFATVLMITVNQSFITGNNNDTNLDKEPPKTSAVSGKIRIINNSGWVDFRNAGNCTGSGTYSNPYIIEDLVIDGGGSGNSISIENSNVYFKIENCTLYNAEWGSDAGIRLLNVNNSQLIGNNCSYSQVGIELGDRRDYSGGGYNNTINGNNVNNNRGGMYLFDGYNNTISNNTANNNTWSGIYLVGSNYTVVSGNTMNDNNMCGINIGGGHNNLIVSGNTMNDNNMHGLWIDESFNNTISGNVMNNNNWSGIILIDSNYNVILGNTAFYNIECGIFLYTSSYNTISRNTANYNQWGIYLLFSNYNTISGNNLIGNDECIVEFNCQGNLIQDNDCTLPPITPSLNYLPNILIISTAIIGIAVFMIYKNGKMFKKPQEDLDFL
jgi:parallel beta-helix repeat protein